MSPDSVLLSLPPRKRYERTECIKHRMCFPFTYCAKYCILWMTLAYSNGKWKREEEHAFSLSFYVAAPFECELRFAFLGKTRYNARRFKSSIDPLDPFWELSKAIGVFRNCGVYRKCGTSQDYSSGRYNVRCISFSFLNFIVLAVVTLPFPSIMADMLLTCLHIRHILH